MKPLLWLPKAAPLLPFAFLAITIRYNICKSKIYFPAAKEAGYAGGIVSAAIDGERVAVAVSEKNKE